MDETPHSSVKMNCGGSVLQERCDRGCIIKNHQGITFRDYSTSLGQCTNNYPEAATMLFGLKWCVNKNLMMTQVETDLLLLTKCIIGEWKIPWNINSYIKETQSLIEVHGFTISHCYRETNKLEDKLASLSHRFNGNQVSNYRFEILDLVKGLINMDKWNYPSFMKKNTKHSLIVYEPP